MVGFQMIHHLWVKEYNENESRQDTAEREREKLRQREMNVETNRSRDRLHNIIYRTFNLPSESTTSSNTSAFFGAVIATNEGGTEFPNEK